MLPLILMQTQTRALRHAVIGFSYRAYSQRTLFAKCRKLGSPSDRTASQEEIGSMARAWERCRTASGTAWQTTEGTAREIALISYRSAVLPAKCEVAHTSLPIRHSKVPHSDIYSGRQEGTWHRKQNQLGSFLPSGCCSPSPS
jgi:hypothetical protein